MITEENKQHILSLFDYMKDFCTRDVMFRIFVDTRVIISQAVVVKDGKDETRVGKFIRNIDTDTLEIYKSNIIEYRIHTIDSKVTISFTKEEYDKHILPIIKLRLQIEE